MSDDGSQVELDPTVDFIAGTIAGIASLVVGFPFDTVKVRFQNPAIAPKYSSTMHAIATIVHEERFIGLFKGITSPLAAVALMNGLVFSSYRFLMKLQLENNNSTPTLTQIALAGAGSGIISSIVTTPTELIKIRQQSLLVPTTATRVAWHIIQESGVAGLYRGLVVTALRDCGYGAYFWAYEATCRLLSTPIGPLLSGLDGSIPEPVAAPNSLSWQDLMLAGGVAGVAGWVATFPLDVVKTRIQGSDQYSRVSSFMEAPVTSPVLTAPSTSSCPLCPERAPLLTSSSLMTQPHRQEATTTIPNPYRSIFSTIIHSYRSEGISVFFRGLAPTLIRGELVDIAFCVSPLGNIPLAYIIIIDRVREDLDAFSVSAFWTLSRGVPSRISS